MNANTHSTFGRHYPRMRVIQYSRDAKINSRCRGVLDRPVKPDDDRRCAPHKRHTGSGDASHRCSHSRRIVI
jgi:hypothetical protein